LISSGREGAVVDAHVVKPFLAHALVGDVVKLDSSAGAAAVADFFVGLEI
jgi:hypothetical protein